MSEVGEGIGQADESSKSGIKAVVDNFTNDFKELPEPY